MKKLLAGGALLTAVLVAAAVLVIPALAHGGTSGTNAPRFNNRFTAADLNVSIAMSLINRLSLDITRYPNARAWLDTCLGRPAGKGFV